MTPSKSTLRRSQSKTQTTSWFDKFPTWKKDLFCILFLYGVILVLFSSIIFNNFIFSDAGDTLAHESWEKAIEHIEKSEGVLPYWMPYIFSGMPLNATLIFPQEVNYVQEYLVNLVGKILFLGTHLHWMIMPYFVMGLFVFYFARILQLPHIAALIAAVTMMLSPYAIGLSQVGHGSKLIVLGYVPLLFLVTHLLFKKRNVFFLSLLGITIGTVMLSRHPQIAFYGLLLIGSYLIYEIFFDIKEKQFWLGVRKGILFVAALVIGIAIYAYQFLPTNEYAQYSIRGGGEAGIAGGLGYDYATNWSFHPFEILNFLVPSFFGFESPYYWGWMPFTDTTVYLGIVPVLLGIIALVYKKNKEILFLCLFSLFILLMSFGKHLPLLYDLFFNYVPFFNKFRAPVMILHVMPLTVGLLAAYGFTALSNLVAKSEQKQIAVLRKGLLITVGVIGALLIIGFVAKDALFNTLSGFMFVKEGDLEQLRQQHGQQAPLVLGQLKQMRFDFLVKDYLKFTLLTAGAIGLILLYLKGRLRMFTFGLSLLAVLVVDLLIIDTKFINPKPRASIEQKFAYDRTVQFLKADTSLYRILPLGALFQDNTWMSHTIQSVAGYSPAKLKIYQDIIDSCLFRGADPNFPLNSNIIDMLNVKYIIAQGQIPSERYVPVEYDKDKNYVTHLNRQLMSRAWFVGNVVVTQNKREIFATLNSPLFDPRTTAIVEKPLQVQLTKPDSVSVVVHYKSQQVSLNVYCSSTSLLVLSEIYYPAGWKAYIDGTETEIYKTNYILRSVVVPAGEHKVEFRYEPQSYKKGYLISNIGWSVALVLLVVGVLQIPKIRGRFLGRV